MSHASWSGLDARLISTDAVYVVLDVETTGLEHTTERYHLRSARCASKAGVEVAELQPTDQSRAAPFRKRWWSSPASPTPCCGTCPPDGRDARSFRRILPGRGAGGAQRQLRHGLYLAAPSTRPGCRSITPCWTRWRWSRNLYLKGQKSHKLGGDVQDSWASP